MNLEDKRILSRKNLEFGMGRENWDERRSLEEDLRRTETSFALALLQKFQTLPTNKQVNSENGNLAVSMETGTATHHPIFALQKRI
jgi:hypothetical protein